MKPKLAKNLNSTTMSSAVVQAFDVTPIIPPPGTKAKPRPRGRERKPSRAIENGAPDLSTGKDEKK